MSQIGPNNFLFDKPSDIKNDAITLALNTLNMNMGEYNGLSKYELQKMKNNMSNNHLTNCALNILSYYNSGDDILQFKKIGSGLQLHEQRLNIQKPEIINDPLSANKPINPFVPIPNSINKPSNDIFNKQFKSKINSNNGPFIDPFGGKLK